MEETHAGVNKTSFYRHTANIAESYNIKEPRRMDVGVGARPLSNKNRKRNASRKELFYKGQPEN